MSLEQMLKNDEVSNPGFYNLWRTDDDDGPLRVKVVKKDGKLYAGEDNINPITSYDEECRWELVR
jgi:hypothetical protein